MLDRPATIATNGAALAVISFGAGLFYNVIPAVLWQFATALLMVLFWASCSLLMLAYYLVIFSLFLMINPVTFWIFALIVIRHFQKRANA